MNLEDIKRVAVIGAGTMGSQIAQLFSQVGGYNVRITDVSEDVVNKGILFLKEGLKKYFVDKGKMTEAQMSAIVDRIKGAPNIADCVRDADFIVEAAYENIDVKKDIFRQLDESAPASTILVTNTSYMNTSEIASVTSRPNKVVGMHFFNPAALMKLVEVVKGPLTSEEIVEIVVALAKKLGKEPIVCHDFSFGFVANRVHTAMQEEAVRMVWERVASPEEIDKAMRLGYGFPMGPLELGDFAGTWILWAGTESEKIKAMGPERGHLHPLVRMMVRAGYTGGRGKKGMYDFYKEVMSKQ